MLTNSDYTELLKGLAERHKAICRTDGKRVFTKVILSADPVAKHMSQPLPLVGAGEPVEAVRKALEQVDAVMVVADGKPTGVLTRLDLLGVYAG